MSNVKSRYWRESLLALVALCAIGGTSLVAPIAQDPAYHAFVDTRAVAGLPNFWNVVSNIGFVLAGLYGAAISRRLTSPQCMPRFLVFCIAVICVGVGSSYYHYALSTPALLWDRLPMSVAFMALFSFVIGDRLGWRAGNALFYPLLVLGAGSVLYWSWTESHAGATSGRTAWCSFFQ